MKFAIADPPYLGRANRWYGSGCGNGKGIGKADSHPLAKDWDLVETHHQLIDNLNFNYDGWAIALTVHSLSQYLDKIKTDSRSGIRVLSWVKPSAVPSGNRVTTGWEPVIVKIPQERRNWQSGIKTKDYLIENSNKRGFIGSKPEAWTHWVLDVLGVRPNDEVVDLFNGSGAVMEAIKTYKGFQND